MQASSSLLPVSVLGPFSSTSPGYILRTLLAQGSNFHAFIGQLMHVGFTVAESWPNELSYLSLFDQEIAYGRGLL